MKVLSIQDISRKDVPIYYRRLFTGTAVLELMDKTVKSVIDFSIEHKPTGQKEITVSFADKIDYPFVPLTKEIKRFIDVLDNSGGLPG